jgi:hypothetical protein
VLEKTVLDILNDPEPDGQRLNSLTDEFREGRDAIELRPLLQSANDDVVWIGLYIFNEILVRPEAAAVLVPACHRLLNHGNASVRNIALRALYEFLDLDEPQTREILGRMEKDCNEEVRMTAERILKN